MNEKLARAKRTLAVCGKGGVGKTAFTSLLVSELVRGGRAGRILAIDADPAVALPGTLGIQAARTIGQVREALLEAARSRPSAQELAGQIDYMVMEALVEAPDFALLAMGHSDGRGCFCSVNDLLRRAIGLLSSRFDTVVIDGEAGLEQLNRQVMGDLDDLVLLTDGSSRGLQTVAHLRDMVRREETLQVHRTGVVFNRVLDGRERLVAAAEEMGLEVLGFVPQDLEVLRFDMEGTPLPQLSRDAEAPRAVRAIAARLLG